MTAKLLNHCLSKRRSCVWNYFSHKERQVQCHICCDFCCNCILELITSFSHNFWISFYVFLPLIKMRAQQGVSNINLIKAYRLHYVDGEPLNSTMQQVGETSAITPAITRIFTPPISLKKPIQIYQPLTGLGWSRSEHLTHWSYSSHLSVFGQTVASRIQIRSLALTLLTSVLKRTLFSQPIDHFHKFRWSSTAGEVNSFIIVFFHVLLYFLQVGDYTLTMKTPHRNKHFRIIADCSGTYRIGPQLFHSLDDLVEHYTRHAIYRLGSEKLFLVKPFAKTHVRRNGRVSTDSLGGAHDTDDGLLRDKLYDM